MEKWEIEGPRGARPQELDEVLDLVNLVFRTSRGLPPTMGEEFPLLFNPENVENLRVVKVDGKIVSHVGIFECEALVCGCRLKVGMIGSVCTHPKYRGRGLATMLVEDALGKMARDGVNVVMVSGIRRLYDRAGCAIAGRSYDVELDPKDFAKIGQGEVEIVEAGAERAIDFVKVYQMEPVRYSRPCTHFAMLLEGRAWSSGRLYARRSLLLYEEGELAGYLVVHVSDETREARVVEYAGSRRAVIEALAALGMKENLQRISLKMPEWDVRMKAELKCRRVKVPEATSRLAGTLRLLNVEDTFERLEPYFAERGLRVEALVRDGCYIVKVDGEEFVARSDKELAWLVLGLPDNVPEPFRKFMPREPLKIPSSFSKALPIPFPTYGLYYT